MGDAAGRPLALDPVAQAVSASRRYVTDRLTDLGAEELLESAELGVSELVTNAVLHGRTPLTISVRRGESGQVRIDVTDRSPLPPQQRRFSVSATTGRGLRLVASVSRDWGVDPLPQGDGPGKTVWFEPLDNPSRQAFVEADWTTDIDALR